MYFITDKITDLRSLTAKRIREIVEDEFETIIQQAKGGA